MEKVLGMVVFPRVVGLLEKIISFAWFMQRTVSSYLVLVLAMAAASESAVPVVSLGLPGASSLQAVV